jgi:UDP-N-acetylbacillosamine N-acetyltransferase
MRTGPNIRKRTDGRFEARYIKSRTEDGKINYGFCYGNTYEDAEAKRNAILGVEAVSGTSEKHMNIILLGAGDLGSTLEELLRSLRIFEKIDYLDDFKTGDNIIGKCEDYLSFLKTYPVAIPAFGDNQLRKKWFERLQKAGFILPILVHPTALVSPSARLGQGTVVEARATVNSGVIIGKGCIISTSVTVDVSSDIGDFTYTAPGITIPKRTIIEPMSNILL